MINNPLPSCRIKSEKVAFFYNLNRLIQTSMDKTTVPATALEMGNNEATVQHYTKLCDEKHSTYDRDGGASHPPTEGCKA